MLARLNRLDQDKAWPYIITSGPAKLPLLTGDVQGHLKLSDACMGQDENYIRTLIHVVTDYAEKYTKRDFITRTYETYRDSFHNDMELRRTPLQSVTKVEYLVDDALTTVSTDIYFVALSNTFAHLALNEGETWPTDEDCREQAVKITFIAGYGDDASDVPEALRIGMLQHLAALYENRGDCDEGRVSGGLFSTAQKFLPVDAQLIYDMYRIRSL